MGVLQRERLRLVLERTVEPAPDPGPTDPDVLRAIGALPGMQRASVVLFYFEDRPLAEIADIMGCSPSTARGAPPSSQEAPRRHAGRGGERGCLLTIVSRSRCRRSSLLDRSGREARSFDRPRKAHRAVIRQRMTNTIIVVALAAAALYLGPGIADVIQNQRTEPADPVTSAQLTGSYRTDLAAVDPELLAERLAGLWMITLSSDGSIVWIRHPRQASGSFPRDTYQVSGSGMVTNVFARSLCQGSGVGSYRWTSRTRSSGSSSSAIPASHGEPSCHRQSGTRT